MPDDRPPIPRHLERELFIEAGYRCAIPTCRAVTPLQIDHIEDWARVQEHKFENMIVLCANCHGRKGDKRGQIDRIALRQYKANLALLNHRYGDFERRMLDYLVANPEAKFVILPGGMDLLVHYLIVDGYLAREADFAPAFVARYGYEDDNDGTQLAIEIPYQVAYSLTVAGREFIRKWQEARPLDGEA